MTKGNDKYQAEIARKIGEERGLGAGRDYEPWIKVHEISSRGRSHSVWGATTSRRHHLLSDLELAFFYRADFSPHVCDIREQFPLFPVSETKGIAKECGIKHPVYPRSSVDVVLTTDFVLTEAATGRLLARSVKYCVDLGSQAVLANQELEKQYWNRRGVDWRLVTERDISKVTLRNFQWLSRGATETYETSVELGLLNALAEARPHDTIQVAVNRAAKALGMTRATAFVLFQHLIWTHKIHVDMDVPLTLTAQLGQIRLSIPSLEGQNYAGAA